VSTASTAANTFPISVLIVLTQESLGRDRKYLQAVLVLAHTVSSGGGILELLRRRPGVACKSSFYSLSGGGILELLRRRPGVACKSSFYSLSGGGIHGGDSTSSASQCRECRWPISPSGSCFGIFGSFLKIFGGVL
jgi:hypothetical protein